MTLYKPFQIVLFFVLLSVASHIQAQNSTNTTGGEASGTGGTVSFSLGQVFYTTVSSGDGEIEQGVQHAYEIITVGSNDTRLNISLNAFPNPTSEILILQINNYNNEILLYQLLDLNGKIVESGKISLSQTQINTSLLPISTYFLDVSNLENKKVQSFKILKK
jgi:hypothetical protein